MMVFIGEEYGATITADNRKTEADSACPYSWQAGCYPRPAGSELAGGLGGFGCSF